MDRPTAKALAITKLLILEKLRSAITVRIFHGNTSPDNTPIDGQGIWSALKEGHGKDFTSDGFSNSYSSQFGPEVTLGIELQKLFPNDHIAIIKYARGGTSIDHRAARKFGCWQVDFNKGTGPHSSINQFDHFKATVKNAMAVKDIDGDGEADTLIPSGVFWLQGESDASTTITVAKAYKDHLKILMTAMRKTFKDDKLPIVIGRMTDRYLGQEKPVWRHGKIVRQLQAEYCEEDKNAILLTANDSYPYIRRSHYDTEAFISLGKDFVASFKELLKKTTQE